MKWYSKVIKFSRMPSKFSIVIVWSLVEIEDKPFINPISHHKHKDGNWIDYWNSATIEKCQVE